MMYQAVNGISGWYSETLLAKLPERNDCMSLLTVLIMLTFRWRDEEAESTGGLIVYDRDEVAEDSSPIAQTLEGLQRIVIGVSEISILIMEDVNWDPVEVRL